MATKKPAKKTKTKAAARQTVIPVTRGSGRPPVDAEEDAAELPADETKGYTFMKTEMNQAITYYGTIPIMEIYPYCKTNPFEKTETHEGGGFQRLLDMKRAKAIAAYVSDGDGIIPTNIVLIAQPEAGLEFDRRSKQLRFRKVPGAFLTGDGQHRMEGFHIAATEHNVHHRILVGIVDNIDRRRAAKMFSDINHFQEGLSSSLLLRIKEQAETETEKEMRLRELFDLLATDAESPLCGKLCAARSVAGKLSAVAFNRAMGPITRIQPFEKDPPGAGKFYTMLRNFFGAAADALPADRRDHLVRATWFAALCEIFDDATQETARRQNNLKRGAYKTTLGPVVAFDAMPGGRMLPKQLIVEGMRAALKESKIDVSAVAT